MKIGAHYQRKGLLKYSEFESIRVTQFRKIILELLTETKYFKVGHKTTAFIFQFQRLKKNSKLGPNCDSDINFRVIIRRVEGILFGVLHAIFWANTIVGGCYFIQDRLLYRNMQSLGFTTVQRMRRVYIGEHFSFCHSCIRQMLTCLH